MQLFRELHEHFLTKSTFSPRNILNIAWRPGSARISWGA